MIQFVVYGVPVPQGSKVPGVAKSGKRFVREDGAARLRPWRTAIAEAAKEQTAVHGCLDGPLRLDVGFRFPMPAGRRKAEKLAGVLPKSTKPDIEKLVRAVADAMTVGGLIADDARIADLHASKVEVWNAWTGATIRVGLLAGNAAMPDLPLGGSS